ncbi:hypothetical protein FQA39_LY09141 [Lamprigera yunnana]|nr:hypothetical protein FQA39_LY09141 [Lamprigera yunnana]
MNRHQGITCVSCRICNFRGKRYKCLICPTYDLCSTCYEEGTTMGDHTVNHPMQCVLTRADFREVFKILSALFLISCLDLYYGGEYFYNYLPQSYTCPCCSQMGFTEDTLVEHGTTTHSQLRCMVLCPVCSTIDGGNPNVMTDNFAEHLIDEHEKKRLTSFIDWNPSSLTSSADLLRLADEDSFITEIRSPPPLEGPFTFGCPSQFGPPVRSSSPLSGPSRTSDVPFGMMPTKRTHD